MKSAPEKSDSMLARCMFSGLLRVNCLDDYFEGGTLGYFA